MQLEKSILSLIKDFPLLDFFWEKEIQNITNLLIKPWYFVGGCVRDSLLGLDIYDIDICTTALPEEIEIYLKNFNLITIGKRFGTIGVIYKKYQIEITTTRIDVNTYGRKADVQFSNSFFEDSKRRDLTINGLLYKQNIIIDYHKGLDHLKQKHIEFIGDINQRITEDYLRIIRYLRFLSRYGTKLEYQKEINFHKNGLKIIAFERILSECVKSIKYPIFFNYLNETNLSKFLFNSELYIDYLPHWSKDEKLSYIFLNSDKKISRKIDILRKLIHNFLQNKEFLGNIWLKYDNYLDFFIDLINIFYHKSIDKNIFNYQFPKLKTIGKERGYQELSRRILYLQNYL